MQKRIEDLFPFEIYAQKEEIKENNKTILDVNTLKNNTTKKENNKVVLHCL